MNSNLSEAKNQVNFRKKPKNQAKLAFKFKGFTRNDRFDAPMTLDEYHSFLEKNKNNSLPFQLFILLRFGYGCDNIRPGRETLMRSINSEFGKSYNRLATISEVNTSLKENRLLKIESPLYGYNNFGTNHYLVASNLYKREYLEVLEEFLPWCMGLKAMLRKETVWSARLKASIKARKQALHEHRTLSILCKRKITSIQVTRPEKETFKLPYTINDHPPGCETTNPGTRAPNSPPDWDQIFDSIKHKEIVMIPKHIDDIKSINLTVAGKVRLAPFSPDVIAIADKQTGTCKKTLDDPFRYFVSVCNKQSREKGESPRWGLVTELSLQFDVSPDDPLLMNTTVNEFPTKGRDGMSRAAQWRPANADPLYRSEAQRSHFEQQRAKREQEWAQRPPEEQERLHKKAAEFRALLGIDENGEQTAEPDKAAGFLYHAAKKRWDEKQEPYTHDVPYIEEDGLWEEI